MTQPLGRLEEPPIKEVVCGVIFKSVAGLDPVTLGAYWAVRKDEYPRREFKGPIAPPSPIGLEFSIGPDVGPIRTWLISKNDVFIVQVQHDRFYLNWRARQDEYPRFNDRDGKAGLLTKFLAEERAFETFCASELGVKVELQGIELSKIDHFERGRHWKDPRDLAKLIPMIGEVLELAEQDPVLAVRLTTPRQDGTVEIAIDSLLRVAQPPIPLVKVESRRTIRGQLKPESLEPTFKSANEEVNNLFARLIPEAEHHRFKKGWKP